MVSNKHHMLVPKTPCLFSLIGFHYISGGYILVYLLSRRYYGLFSSLWMTSLLQAMLLRFLELFRLEAITRYYLNLVFSMFFIFFKTKKGNQGPV